MPKLPPLPIRLLTTSVWKLSELGLGKLIWGGSPFTVRLLTVELAVMSHVLEPSTARLTVLSSDAGIGSAGSTPLAPVRSFLLIHPVRTDLSSRATFARPAASASTFPSQVEFCSVTFDVPLARVTANPLRCDALAAVKFRVPPTLPLGPTCIIT